jgi:cytochrome b561
MTNPTKFGQFAVVHPTRKAGNLLYATVAPEGGPVPSLALSASRVRNNRPLAMGARIGLAARALVWLLMGVLAIQIALGNSHRQADQQGALAAVAAQPGGKFLLVVVAAGLACYAVWRLVEAAVGPRRDKDDAQARLTALVRGAMYAILCATAVTVLTGSSGSSQDRRQRGMTAQLMQYTGGRWLVGAVGVVVVGVGVYFAVQGVRGDVWGQMDENRMNERLRRPVEVLGVVGNTARGIVIAFAGVFVIAAAVTADPHNSSGLDGALRTLAQESFGPWVLCLAGAGLIAFGLFGFAEGVWADT